MQSQTSKSLNYSNLPVVSLHGYWNRSKASNASPLRASSTTMAGRTQEPSRRMESCSSLSLPTGPHFVELDVFDNDNSSDKTEGIGFGNNWQRHHWRCQSTLRWLRIVTPRKDLSAPRWAFARHFAATLESLDLSSLPTTAEADLLLKPSSSDSHSVHFPQLRALSAKATDKTACLLLHRFASSPLQHIKLRTHRDSSRVDPSPSDQLYEALKPFGTTLREVHLYHGDVLHLVALGLRSLGETPNVTPCRLYAGSKDDMWVEPRKSRQSLDPRQPASTITRCDAIDEVAHFALNLSGRLRATRDVYGAEVMILAMEPMRSLMIKEQL